MSRPSPWCESHADRDVSQAVELVERGQGNCSRPASTIWAAVLGKTCLVHRVAAWVYLGGGTAQNYGWGASGVIIYDADRQGHGADQPGEQSKGGSHEPDAAMSMVKANSLLRMPSWTMPMEKPWSSTWHRGLDHGSRTSRRHRRHLQLGHRQNSVQARSAKD
jgi:hypothetical protein